MTVGCALAPVSIETKRDVLGFKTGEAGTNERQALVALLYRLFFEEKGNIPRQLIEENTSLVSRYVLDLGVVTTATKSKKQKFQDEQTQWNEHLLDVDQYFRNDLKERNATSLIVKIAESMLIYLLNLARTSNSNKNSVETTLRAYLETRFDDEIVIKTEEERPLLQALFREMNEMVNDVLKLKASFDDKVMQQGQTENVDQAETTFSRQSGAPKEHGEINAQMPKRETKHVNRTKVVKLEPISTPQRRDRKSLPQKQTPSQFENEEPERKELRRIGRDAEAQQAQERESKETEQQQLQEQQRMQSEDKLSYATMLAQVAKHAANKVRVENTTKKGRNDVTMQGLAETEKAAETARAKRLAQAAKDAHQREEEEKMAAMRRETDEEMTDARPPPPPHPDDSGDGNDNGSDNGSGRPFRSESSPNTARQVNGSQDNTTDFDQAVLNLKLEAGMLSRSAKSQVKAAAAYKVELHNLEKRLEELKFLSSNEAKSVGLRLTQDEMRRRKRRTRKLMDELKKIKTIILTLEKGQENYREKVLDVELVIAELKDIIAAAAHTQIREEQGGNKGLQDDTRVLPGRSPQRIPFPDVSGDTMRAETPESESDDDAHKRLGRFPVGPALAATDSKDFVYLRMDQYNNLLSSLDLLSKEQWQYKNKLTDILRKQRQRIYQKKSMYRGLDIDSDAENNDDEPGVSYEVSNRDVLARVQHAIDQAKRAQSALEQHLKDT